MVQKVCLKCFVKVSFILFLSSKGTEQKQTQLGWPNVKEQSEFHHVVREEVLQLPEAHAVLDPRALREAVVGRRGVRRRPPDE